MGYWKETVAGWVAAGDALLDRMRCRLYQHVPPRGPFLIMPYVGYGTPEQLTVSGRIFKDKGIPPPSASHTSWQNLREFYKRMVSRELPGALVRARFAGAEYQTETDHEGYFTFVITPDQPLTTFGWHSVVLELLPPRVTRNTPVTVQARVIVPPPTARFGVISDIDDTIVWTNARRRVAMIKMLMRANAHTRKPFEGIASFYQALQQGSSGAENNPIFYVSSSPWNLFTPLIDFLQVQHIPLGPLFLKDYGDHTLFTSSDHQSHKLSSIQKILDTYPHLPFILIGDSGEQDPEIYEQVVARYPDRIRAIYIRNVNPDPVRVAAVEHLAEQVQSVGSQLVLVPDSEYAAVHAAMENLIAQEAVAKVRADKKEEQQHPLPEDQ